MDSFDIALLNAPQEDGRLTNFELAERVGSSASQCSRRRAALEEARVISSYHARLSGEALGLDIIVLIQVTLATHSPYNSQQFHKLINSLAELQEACSLTGEADYLVRPTVPGLMSLSRIHNDVLLPHGRLAHVQSSIGLDRVKRSMSLPLSDLPGSKADATVARSRGATAATDAPNCPRRVSPLKSRGTKHRKELHKLPPLTRQTCLQSDNADVEGATSGDGSSC